jgi:mycocyclosin synthase
MPPSERPPSHPISAPRAVLAGYQSAGMHCRILGMPQYEAAYFLRSLDIAFMNSRCPVKGAEINWSRDITRMTELLNLPGVDGLLGDLAALRGEEGYAHLTDEMLATVGVTMFGAGVISTSGFLTMALVSVMQRPMVKDHLVDHPEDIGPAVEELLRVNLSIGDALPRLEW